MSKEFLRYWGCYTWRKAQCLYNHLRNTLVRFSQSGWRQMFFWSCAITMSLTLPMLYLYFPLEKEFYAPPEFIAGFNTTLGLVLIPVIVRAFEKAHERTNGGLVNNEALK